ncbi:MAG TPA: hypothetical protein VF160_04500 [Candidatus Dormibacteraeota bacterium]
MAFGFGLIIVHNIDEAFFHLEDGGKMNLVGDVLVAVLALVFLRRLAPPWRAGILTLLGLLAMVVGIAGHVVHIVVGKAAPIDYSGVLFVLGGAVLLGLGMVVFMARRTDAVGARR